MERDCPVGLSAVASSLAQCGVGWWVQRARPRWPSLSSVLLCHWLQTGLEQRLIPPHTQQSLPLRWSPGPSVEFVPLPEAPSQTRV